MNTYSSKNKNLHNRLDFDIGGITLMFGKNSKKKEIMLQNLAERQGEAKTVRKIVFFTTIAIAVIIAIVGIAGFVYVNSALKPVDSANDETITVEIPIGSSTSTIASILEENHVIKNATIFKYYVKFQNESGFQAGTYELTQSMELSEIVDTIKTGKLYEEAVLKLTIPEGLQLKQIASILAEKTNQDTDEVFAILNSKEFIVKMQLQFPDLLTDEIWASDIKYPLEGYLFPATYEYFTETPSLETIVIDMISQTDKIIDQYRALMEEKEMTPHTLLTMASLIEEEATQQTDRKTIASVFYNRLEIGMPLQTDPTVAYALGKHLDRTFYSHLEIDDPYNTYKYAGLTPGPIANAGESSIVAALEPEETDYLYFLANAKGEVFFSTTLEEHNALKTEHIN